MAEVLHIRRVRVRRGAIDFEVEAALSTLHVTQQAAECICSLLPNLPNHICVGNDDAPQLGAEIVGTETPHLLEHVIIELQGQAHGSGDFTGHTSWAAELAETRPFGFALMRTTVSFQNDFVALAAANEAVRLIEWAYGDETEPPDVDALVESLKQRL